MSEEVDRSTNPETNALWMAFAKFVLGGDDSFTAMNKAVELEGWVKK